VRLPVGRKSVLFVVSVALIATGLTFIVRVTHATGTISVKGRVNFTPTLKVYPEKRVPLVGNWKNQATVEIRSPGTSTPLFTQVVETDTSGSATMQSLDTSMVPAGSYDIAVKGISHLRRVYSGVPFVANTVNIDLSTGGRLIAGDLNSDNYINSMDLSHQVRTMYSRNDTRTDLNRDGIVNSLDISNTSFNLFLKGSR
jgi:hypothetical protein